MTKYILINATITDGFSFLIKDGAIEIENGRIVCIGKSDDLWQTDVETIDLQGRLVLPGLLNPHHHLYSALATGLAPIGPTTNFKLILENLWWHLDKTMDAESIYYSAIHGLIQSVKYGVTTIFDHHASMNAVGGSLELIEKAFREIGVKGLLCYEISDRMGEEQLQVQLDENI
ncbi:amidohydrolase family protein, partial [bacterium]|nr:amidohydrolase family protein [bacterium]